MKKTLIILLFFASLGAMAQVRDFDTVRLIRGGKVWQLITFGNSDSVKINGIVFHISTAGTETDPVWISDSVDYPKKTYSDNRYEYKIPSETYMTKDENDTISGYKTFVDAALQIFNATGNGITSFSTLVGHNSGNNIVFPAVNGTVALTSDISSMSRYSVYSSGANNVEVLADSTGITAAFTGSTEITFSIPAGVKLISAKIRLGTGYSTLTCIMGTSDMANTSATNRWMPIVQGWREDTGISLGGLTTRMDPITFTKFTINGIFSTSACQIRLSF